MPQPHSPFQSALPATRRAQGQQAYGNAQSFLDPRMAQLLNQQGTIDPQIAGLERSIARTRDDIEGPLPAIINPGARMQVAPHWTQALSKAANNLTSRVKGGRLEKTLRAKEQELADYTRDVGIAGAEEDARRFHIDTNLKEDELEIKREKIASDLALAKADKERAAAIRQQDLGREDARDIRTGVRQLSEDMIPMLESRGALQTLDRAISPFMEGGESQGEDVPGLGTLEGAPGPVGLAWRTVMDMRDEGSPRADMYTKVRTLLNKMLRENAGLAQTLTEVRNTLQGTGMEGWSDQEVFLAHYPEIRKRHDEKINAVVSGYSEPIGMAQRSVADAYQERFGKIEPLRDFADINAERMANSWKSESSQYKPGDPSPDGTHVVAPDGQSWIPIDSLPVTPGGTL